MKVLVIDNYDSFTYNLVQMLGSFKSELVIRRNDMINDDEIETINPDKILISPGPGRPENSGISVSAIKNFGQKKPVLGVCLGHQAIGVVYGAEVITAPALMHGKVSSIKHDGKTVFNQVPQNFIATRYHSLIIDKLSLPTDLEVSAYADDGTIMGVRHKHHPVEGIQFHPESILTTQGNKIINNWLKL